jgi:hypothetical protein
VSLICLCFVLGVCFRKVLWWRGCESGTVLILDDDGPEELASAISTPCYCSVL